MGNRFVLYEGRQKRVFGRDDVRHVELYKRDEPSTGVVCCEITSQIGKNSEVIHIDEKMSGFEPLMALLAGLPGFRQDWRSEIGSRTIAFHRNELAS
jgi:hypothetical protein